MNSYANVSVAHAELLLVTCLKSKTFQGIKPPPASTSSVEFPVAFSTSKQSQTQGIVKDTTLFTNGTTPEVMAST